MLFFKNKAFQITVILLAIIYCLIEAQGAGDLLIFLAAAGDLTGQGDIYSKAYFDSYHYYYSVLFAVLIQPFYHLSFYWVKFFWILFNLLLFLHLLAQLNNYLLSVLDEKKARLVLLITFIFSLRFLHENLHASQITIVILWCCISGLRLISSKRAVSGAVLLTVGINLKLLPIVFLPYLIYRGYFKAFFLTIFFYISFLFLPSIIIGHEYNMSLLSSWFNLINPLNKQHIMDTDERSFHSLTTLLTTLFIANPPDPLAMDLKRNIADISLQGLSALILGVRLLLVLLTLYFLKLKTFLRPAPFPKTELSYMLLIIPLIFPHQQHYAFLFAVPAYCLVVLHLVTFRENISTTTFRIVSILLVLIYLCANLKMLLGEFNRYYEHYKILTYGALLLIPLLVWVRKRESSFVLDERNVAVT